MPDPDTEPTVIARRQGRVGRLTLNRPKALNALTLDMVGIMQDALTAWEHDPAVHLVVVEGAGGRAFCAGGDIRAIRDAAVAGDWERVQAFLAGEYAVNLRIARYTKPYVALVDGICMGGGMGVSVHGAFRVATEAAVFAMPEIGIGLFPDVGMGYVLPRLRGHVGMYMALAGARLSGADAVYAGLATHFTTRERLAGLADELAEHGLAALAEAAIPAPATALAGATSDLACFGGDSVPSILHALEQRGTSFAAAAVEAMRAGSPSSVLWSFELMRAGAKAGLEEAFEADLALARVAAPYPDFVEGVRAMVVDKDRSPRWHHARIEDVPVAEVNEWRRVVTERA